MTVRRREDPAFVTAMAGLRFGRTLTPPQIARLRPEDRYAYEAEAWARESGSKTRPRGEAAMWQQYEKNLVAMAEASGRLAALRESTVRNPDFIETMRLQCWSRMSAKSLRLAPDGTTVTAPPGWPVGVDAVTYVAEQYDRVSAEVEDRAAFERWKAARDGA